MSYGGRYDIDDGGFFTGYLGDAERTAGMTSPVRCRWCGGIYDLGKVTVTGRYTDCSMWKAPCCGVLADDRKPPWGVSHYTELPRRNRAFVIADEDVTFPDDGLRACSRCGDRVAYLSSRDMCDGCEEEAARR